MQGINPYLLPPLFKSILKLSIKGSVLQLLIDHALLSDIWRFASSRSHFVGNDSRENTAKKLECSPTRLRHIVTQMGLFFANHWLYSFHQNSPPAEFKAIRIHLQSSTDWLLLSLKHSSRTIFYLAITYSILMPFMRALIVTHELLLTSGQG